MEDDVLCVSCYDKSGLYQDDLGEWNIDEKKQRIMLGVPGLIRDDKGVWKVAEMLKLYHDDGTFRRRMPFLLVTSPNITTAPYALKQKNISALRNDVYCKYWT